MNTTQSGRSMLEMLAVLCVIGVLTVGVLLGYRQALIRYKTYRTHVEMSEIVDGVYRVCHLFSDLEHCAERDVDGDIVDANIVADMKNPFGPDYEVNLGSDSTISTDVTDPDVCKELEAEDWPAGVRDDAGHEPDCDGTTITLHLEP